MNSQVQSKFSIDYRVLSLLLVLAAVILMVGTWWVFRSHESAYLEMVGTHLSEAAEMAFSSVNVYLQDQIIAVAGLTEVPDLREAVKKGNLDLAKSLDEVRRAIPAMETSWPSLDRGSAQLKSILDNPASDFLRRYSAVDKSYREIMVTDFLGRLVAATGKTTDYYQADEEWWKETYGDGRSGSVYIGDIRYDDSAKVYSMELAQPFVEPERGIVGVIKVVLDAQGIHSLIGSIRAGPSTTAMLIRAKGEVVSAPGYHIQDQKTYPGTLDILNAREKEKRYFVSSSSPTAVYGLTQRNFQDLYPHLNWILVTTGPTKDLLGPVPQLRRSVIVLVVAILLSMVISTLILTRTLSKPVVEEDPHLEKL